MTTITEAADWLGRDGIVVYPTDTVYGLAVNPCSVVAVSHLFDLKGRGAQAALPLIAASLEQVEALCGALGPIAARLAAGFWPGPLSLVLNAPSSLAPAVHAGGGSVAIRVPANQVATALAAAFGSAITATSANRSGEPAVNSVSALGSWRNDPRVLVIDDGETPGGPPSTIVDARGAQPVLVRDGAVPWRRVLEFLNE